MSRLRLTKHGMTRNSNVLLTTELSNNNAKPTKPVSSSNSKPRNKSVNSNNKLLRSKPVVTQSPRRRFSNFVLMLNSNRLSSKPRSPQHVDQ